jgi:hypothetical protein
MCPVCTIGVAAGVGLCRYLGIDDLISGVWIGALLIYLVLWTIEFLNRKKIKFLFRKPLIFAFFYLLTIWTFYHYKIIGQEANKFLGIDKLVFGIMAGTIGLLIGINLNNYLIRRNNGKVYFKFQKVIVPIFILIILSLIFWKIC